MTAYGSYGKQLGFDASAALTKFRFVKLTGAPETVGPVTAITDQPIGVVQFSITAAELLKGKGASVLVDGVTEVEVNEAVDEGQRAGLGSDGRVGVAAAGERLVGIFLTAAPSGGRASLQIQIEHGALAA